MRSPTAKMGGHRARSAAVLVILALAACGGGRSVPVPTGDSPRASSGTVTNANGSYRVTLSVGARAPGATPPTCAPASAPGFIALPVVMTVVNESPDQPVPFPPLRVELVGGGGSPAEVRMQEPSGTCTFTPRQAAIEAAGSVSFTGSTPAIAEATPPGGAGAVQVSLSESDFTVSVAVP